MAKLLQFLQRYPKPAFSSPKSSRRLKGPKELRRKRDYPLICMHFQSKDWRRIWRKKLLQNCPIGQVIAIFARSPKPAFSEKVPRGDQGKFLKKCTAGIMGNFSKNRQKSTPNLKGPTALGRKWFYPLSSMLL